MTKKAIDPGYVHLVKKEIDWYTKYEGMVGKEGKLVTPHVYSFNEDSFTMDYLATYKPLHLVLDNLERNSDIMKIKKLYNQNGVREALSNILFRVGSANATIVELRDAVDTAETEAQLLAHLARLHLGTDFVLDRSKVEVVDGQRNVTWVRLVSTDYCGNRHYLECVKA